MLHLGGAGRIAKGEQPHPGRFRVSGDGNIAAQGGCLDIQDAITIEYALSGRSMSFWETTLLLPYSKGMAISSALEGSVRVWVSF